MTITERFKESMTDTIYDQSQALYKGLISCENMATIIRNITIEHEGKKYALRIVELDAEIGIPSARYTHNATCYDCLNRLLNNGWVKGMSDET